MLGDVQKRIYIRENLKTSRWVAVKPSLIDSELKLLNRYIVSCIIGIIYVMVLMDSTKKN